MKVINKRLLLAGIAVCGMLLAGCGAGDTPAQPGGELQGGSQVESSAEAAQEDVYVLSFEATTVEGESMTSDIFTQSKLTMVNVWATYCNPCLKEMPDLGAIAASYDADTFQIIGIVSDVTNEAGEDDINLVKELVAETQADYPHLLLNESLYVNLVGAVDAVPTTFFFNEKGELLGYLVGSYERAAWEEIITGLLADIS